MDLRLLGHPINRPPEPEITLDGVTAGYGAYPAIRDVAGCFERGSLTAIVGPNGAGKSTLMKTIVGSLKPTRGTVAIAPRATLAYLPQRSSIDQDFPITVWDTIMLGHCRRLGWHRAFDKAAQEIARQALDRVGLAAIARRPVATLSSGQFQRALFARLIVEDASLILLDEPFSAVDARTVADLLQLIVSWQAEGRTIVAVLHDIAEVRSHFPRTLLLARDVIGWGPTDSVLTAGNLEQARRMAEDWDSLPNPGSRLHA